MVWLVLVLVFALLATHPFVSYPVSLRIAAWLTDRRHAIAGTNSPPLNFAILFCAYNEEAVIEQKLQNCVALQAANPGTRILVYTDGCSDRTADIARRFADHIRLVEGHERRGKSFGMNQLARAARVQAADILFFTDANVILDPNALAAMRSEFADPLVGCVTGHLDYVNPNESPTALVGARYWSADEMIKRLETRSGSCMGADGSIFGIRAHLFEDVPENIIDDFYTSMSVICSGWRCIYSPRVIAYERSATRSAEEYRRKIRIACRAFNCHRLLWPRLRRLGPWNLYKYVSHKLLRWLMAFWIVGAALAAAIGVVALGLPWGWLALFAILLGALGIAIIQLPGAPWTYGRQAVIAIIATGIGVLKSLQGERFQTWSAAATTREAATLRSPSES